MSSRPPRAIAETLARFACHQCGACCRGDGYVSLTHDDIVRISEHLGMEPADFLEEHAHFDDPAHEWRLLDQLDELQSCIFLEADNTCRIHPVKPEQCVGFPRKWRPENIAEFCRGWRIAAGLQDDGGPEADRKDTMA